MNARSRPEMSIVDLAGFRLQKAAGPRTGDCLHRHVVIDERRSEAQCADCHVLLNPMWVLNQLAGDAGRKHERTCEHCGKMMRV